MKSWENRIREEFHSPKVKFNHKRIFLEWLDGLDFLHSKSSSVTARFILHKIRNVESRLALYARNVLTRFFIFDPLGASKKDEIELFFLVAEKDLEILPYSIVAGITSVSNKILCVTVVCPEKIREIVIKNVNKIQKSTEYPISVCSDDSVLINFNLEKFNFCSSYAKMQIIKICIPLLSRKASLIIDADTLLLRKRNWISNNIQISPIAQEYQIGYNKFAMKMLSRSDITGLGFVTHHGLMRKEMAELLVDKFGGIYQMAVEMNEGIRRGWDNELGLPSEWQIYGELVFSQAKNKGSITAGFINIGLSRSVLGLKSTADYEDCLELTTRLRATVPKLGSLSLHSYKDC